MLKPRRRRPNRKGTATDRRPRPKDAASAEVNMVDAVARRFPEARMRAVIGGFHLVGIPIPNTMAGAKKGVRRVGEELLEYPVDRFYTGHCTGTKGYCVLRSVLGDKLEYVRTGSSFDA